MSDAPRRTQNRQTERFDAPRGGDALARFRERTGHRLVAARQRRMGQRDCGVGTDGGIDGNPAGDRGGKSAERPASSEATGCCLDPSRPGVVLARYVQANEADVDRAVAGAKADRSGWRTLSVDARNEILGRVAQELRRARADLMWAALANGGKTLAESDPEVSEAVDFVEFYRASAAVFFELNPRWKPRRAESWSWCLRGIFRSPFRAAAWQPPWRPETP